MMSYIATIFWGAAPTAFAGWGMFAIKKHWPNTFERKSWALVFLFCLWGVIVLMIIPLLILKPMIDASFLAVKREAVAIHAVVFFVQLVWFEWKYAPNK